MGAGVGGLVHLCEGYADLLATITPAASRLVGGECQALPMTATGKVSKIALREQFRDHRVKGAG
jgi:acyl-CoA synthetase (AMP-forming)/AMP-acid ligase II